MANNKLTPLEALDNLRQNYETGAHLFDYKYLDIIETALKVLEIIKDCCIVAEYPNNTYELSFCRKICIEKEEYKLLKEVLWNLVNVINVSIKVALRVKVWSIALRESNY